jgi:PIN domain nuclease of toxin-antitoxin system
VGGEVVRLLLDTHALLWALASDRRLSKRARSAIEDGENEVLTSAASAWEIVIKASVGKLHAPEDLVGAAENVGFALRPITFRDVEALRSLPPLHRDPFDRMLIAQAHTDSAVLVTRDALIRQYPVATLW